MSITSKVLKDAEIFRAINLTQEKMGGSFTAHNPHKKGTLGWQQWRDNYIDCLIAELKNNKGALT